MTLSGDLSGTQPFWTAMAYYYDEANLGGPTPPPVGNLTLKVRYGHIPTPTAGSYPTVTGPTWSETAYRYAELASGGPWAVGLPCQAEQFYPDCADSSCSTDAENLTTTYYVTNSLCAGSVTGDPIENDQLVRYAGDADRTRVTTYAYNTYGDVTEVVDPLGKTTQTTYYNPSNPSASVYAYPWHTWYTVTKGHTTSPVTFSTTIAWDEAAGVPLEVASPSGRVVLPFYDGLSRLKTVESTPPFDTNGTPELLVEMSYGTSGTWSNLSGNYIEEIDHFGTGSGDTVEARTYFDGFGRPVEHVKQRTATDWVVTESAYSRAKQPVVTTLPATTSSDAYVPGLHNMWDGGAALPLKVDDRDWRGRSTWTVLVEGGAGYYGTSHQYSGVTEVTTNPRGFETETVRDGRGNVVQRVEHYSSGPTETTTYGYDGANRLRFIHDPAGNAWTYDYDNLGELRQLSDPDRGARSYTYNLGGKVATKTDARGYVTSYTRDELGRVLTKSYACNGCGAPSISNTYDTGGWGLGKIATAALSDGSAERDFYYDTWGRLIDRGEVRGSSTWWFGPAYDLMGRETQLYYPAGDTVTYGRDKAGLVTDIQYDSQYVVGSASAPGVTYDAMGRARDIDWGNGEVTTRSIGPREKVSELKLDAPTPNGTTMDLSYQYDDDGNPSTVTAAMAGWTRSYTYDWDDRLIGATHKQGSTVTKTWTWSFDDQNRMASSSDYVNSFGTGTYSYGNPAPHQLTRIGTSGLFTYDADGNVTTDGSTGATYTYDVENRVATATGPSAGTGFTFHYGPQGGRIRKTGTVGYGSQWVDYYGPELETSYVGSAFHTDRYVLWGGQRIVKVHDGELVYLHPDVEGSVSVYSSSAGIPLERRTYAPYGSLYPAPTGSTLTFTPRYGYAGSEEDHNLGLLHLGPREDSTSLGLMLQPDPLGPQGRSPKELNPYAYADFNPIFYKDPSGYLPDWVSESIGIAVGTLAALTPVVGPIAAAVEHNPNKAYARGKAIGLGATGLTEMAAGAGGDGVAVAIGGGGAVPTGGASAVPALVIAVPSTAVVAQGALSVVSAYINYQKSVAGTDGGNAHGTGDHAPSSRAARRNSMRKNNTPTSRSATSQSGADGQRQTIVDGSDGKPRVQTQHAPDQTHSDPHWHDGTPKVDDDGQPRLNAHGQVKDQNQGRTTTSYDR